MSFHCLRNDQSKWRRYFSFSLWVLEMLQVLKLAIIPHLTVTFKKWNCHICTCINEKENLFISEHIPLYVYDWFSIKRVEPHKPGGFTHCSFEERMLPCCYCNRMTAVSWQVLSMDMLHLSFPLVLRSVNIHYKILHTR